MSNTSKKSVLVTGACGDIGRAFCAEFNDAGFNVIATDVCESNLGQEYKFIQWDLRQLLESDLERNKFFNGINTCCEGNKLAVIINNAAVQITGSTEEISAQLFQDCLNVNVVVPYILSTLFERDLEYSKGYVINIGSVHASLTKPGFFAYATSKSALDSLTRGLAIELGSKNIKVMCIKPGAINTRMLADGFKENENMLSRLMQYQPIGRIGMPDEIARLAVFIAMGKADFMTGSCIGIDGGISGRLHDPV